MSKLINKHWVLTAATIVAGTCFTSPAQAEYERSVSSLDAITVYATRSPQSTFNSPSMVSKLDTDAAGDVLSGTVADLLEFTPGVEVINGPRRNGQVVSIRGFDDEAIITLIDGRRQNYEANHDGRFFVDPFLLKSVEVVKGASSAIYGGGGVGGVVAFETKDAADFLKPGQNFGATTSLGLRSANEEFVPTTAIYGRTGNFDLLGSLTYRDSGDIQLGDGNELDTEDEMLSGLFKVGYTFDDFNTIKLQAQLVNNDSEEPNNGAQPITSSNPIVDKEIKDYQYSIKYSYDNPANMLLSPDLHLYFNDTEVKEIDISGANNGRVQNRKLETLGFTIDNQSKLMVNNAQKHTLSYGFEVYQDKQVGTNSNAAVRAGAPDAEALNYGLYLQDEMSFETSMGQFNLIPAARFDTYKSDDEIGNSQDESEISPKVSFSYLPNDNLMFFGSWAKAFRAPNLTELYPTGQHFPGVSFCPAPVPGCPPVPLVTVFPDNNFVPNADLEPETVTTYEIGAGYSFDTVFNQQDNAKIKGAYFHSEGDNFITQEINLGAGFTRNFNVPNATLYGWEIESQYNYSNFSAKLGLTYVNAENDDTGEYLSNNVPLTAVTDISYKLTDIDSIIGWRARLAAESDRVGANDVATDGYGVHDVYYRWQPDDAKFDNLTFDIGVSNVFDNDYSKRFATVKDEGRSYNARISYTW